MSEPVALRLLSDELAVARLEPTLSVPDWAMGGALSSITRTEAELSVVCLAEQVPEGVVAERGWQCFEVAGPLDFSLVGILASLTGTLAEAGISIFAISTYDTDYVLVRTERLGDAIAALCRAGHPINGA